MKLQSMTDFVLQEGIRSTAEQQYFLICDYANFLKQPLILGMFIPCDLEGNMLGKQYTKNHLKSINYDGCIDDYALKYKEAKERVLFEGKFIIEKLDNIDGHYRIFKDNVCIWTTISSNAKTIEDLVKYNLELTESAIKELEI